MVNEEWDLIKQRIRDVNAIQTVNAIFQYCPQFLFQSFLIVYRKYKCVITGIYFLHSYLPILIKRSMVLQITIQLQQQNTLKIILF